METNSWRPNASGGVGEPAMDAGDWKAQLLPDARQRIVNKVLETLKRHLPFSGPEGLEELKKLAARFEEKVYTIAVSQYDYLRKISVKMLTMEAKSQNKMANSLPSNSSSNSNKPCDPGASMQAQDPNQGQPLPIPLLANQSQAARQQLLSRNLQNNMVSAGAQSSAGLSPILPPVSDLNQAPMTNAVGQIPNLRNISGVSHMGNSMGQGMPNSLGNSMGQGVPSNIFNNPQRRMPLMATNNWRPNALGGVGEPAMDAGDWKAQLLPDGRQRIVNKMVETLTRHIAYSGQEGLEVIKRMAARFEGKIYSAATSQADYLRKISVKMLMMMTESRNTMPSYLSSTDPPMLPIATNPIIPGGNDERVINGNPM